MQQQELAQQSRRPPGYPRSVLHEDGVQCKAPTSGIGPPDAEMLENGEW